MNLKTAYSTVVAVGLAVAVGVGCATYTTERTTDGRTVVTSRTIDQTISNWPEPSRNAVRDMISKYGQPDGVTPDYIIWQDAGDWKEIFVSREDTRHDFPVRHVDVLTQVVNYEVPVDFYDELAEFDGSIVVERTRGTLSARCDKEPMNYLALNLAYDIITGTKRVSEARAAYADIASRFSRGDRDSYTQDLRFNVTRAGTGDPDESVRTSASFDY